MSRADFFGVNAIIPSKFTLGDLLQIGSEKSERGPFASRGRTEWLDRLDMIHTRPGNTEIHTRHATAGTQPRTSRRRAHGRRRSTRAPRAGDRGALRAAWEPDKAEGTLLRSSKRRRRGFSGAHRARKTPRAPASRRRGGGLPGPHIARSRAQTHGCRRGGRARAYMWEHPFSRQGTRLFSPHRQLLVPVERQPQVSPEFQPTSGR